MKICDLLFYKYEERIRFGILFYFLNIMRLINSWITYSIVFLSNSENVVSPAAAAVHFLFTLVQFFQVWWKIWVLSSTHRCDILIFCSFSFTTWWSLCFDFISNPPGESYMVYVSAFFSLLIGNYLWILSWVFLVFPSLRSLL